MDAEINRIFDEGCGAVTVGAHSQIGRFGDYSKLFIEIPFLTQKEGLHIQPSGKYIRAFHKGTFDKMPLKYQEILDYATMILIWDKSIVISVSIYWL